MGAAAAAAAAKLKLEFVDGASEVKLEEQGKPSSSEEPGAAGSRVSPQGESHAARAGAGTGVAAKAKAKSEVVHGLSEVKQVKQEERGKDVTPRNLAVTEGWEGPSATAPHR